DRERVNARRGANNKVGFALQLTSVRLLGTFLAEPTAVPSYAVAYVAAQLGIPDVACLADYAARPTTAWEHAAEIRRVYGYRDWQRGRLRVVGNYWRTCGTSCARSPKWRTQSVAYRCSIKSN
ncbi:MAG: DUF4158 domain-containing protein, partial [Chloroflexi bacterium]|nr:DUF4158 domain-containing protein [Chloroflexota bacterium]